MARDFYDKKALIELSYVPLILKTQARRLRQKGAFGTTNWMQGWTNFDPQNTDY